MRILLVSLLLVFTAFPVEAQTLRPGIWHGELDTGAGQLRLELHVVSGEDDALEVSLVSLDQGSARIPATWSPSTNGVLELAMPSVGASYRGDWLETGGLSGVFVQAGMRLDLDLAPGAFPALPTAPMDENDQAVSIMSGEVQLAGSLRRPSSEGPAPALLLLNGSGSQDRDFSFGDQKIFANIAGALASAGIASLRLDDRGVGESDPIAPESPDDLASDAAAALAALRAQPGIHPECVGILGHSEGGMIAFLAAPDARPDFILTLAGMNASLADTLVEQGEVIIRASGGNDAAVAGQLSLQRSMFEAMRSATPQTARARIHTAMTDAGLPEQAAAQQAAIWGQAYALAALDLDPSAAIRAYPGPVSALYGALDVQVPAQAASERLRQQRGSQPLTISILPGLNHLFQDADTGLPAEYAQAGPAPADPALLAITQAATDLIEGACPRD